MAGFAVLVLAPVFKTGRDLSRGCVRGGRIMVARIPIPSSSLALLLFATAGCRSNPDCGHDWYGGGSVSVAIEWDTGEVVTVTADGVSQDILDSQPDSVDDFDLGEFSLRDLWEETGDGAAVIGWPRGPDESIRFAMVADVDDFPAGAFETPGGSPTCANLEPIEPPAYLFVGFEAGEQAVPASGYALALIRNGFENDQAVVWDPCDSEIGTGCDIEFDLVDETNGSMVFVEEISSPTMTSCRRQVTTTVSWDFDQDVTRSVFKDCGSFL
jgi:hypothetical protein